jgi:hypothetical protein
MTDLDKSNIESSRDTSPLTPAQLSNSEWECIREIEQRLSEAKETSTTSTRVLDEALQSPYARVQERYRRVLLLDGGRGTGKTSMLQTLVKRWHVAAGIDQGNDALADQSPKNVRVIRILDFDPLPLGMPLLAGIVQALLPTAIKYDPRETIEEGRSDDDQDTLEDLWHRLFRVAALGWSAIPNRSGLIEQVLDREEQVRDWQAFADHWQSFVEKLLDRGKRIPGPERLPKDVVYVIMIDDVDLQVARVRELLPALRILYHPNVFFLVAADQSHLIDMLKLEFFGQQNELARYRNAQNETAINLAVADRWASDLADSAFRKVFPKRNCWKLERLSSLEFLAFPGPVEDLPQSLPKKKVSKRSTTGLDKQNFLKDLSQIKPIRAGGPFVNAGDLILNFANQAHKAKLPGVMTYRSAEQLRQYVMNSPTSRPSEVLAALLSGDADTYPAVPQTSGASGVDVLMTGELAALYRPSRTEAAGNYDVILSARPDFVFQPSGKLPTRMSTKPDNRFNFTGALIAKTLEESYFAVDAAGLRWENYLSLVWTEWPAWAFAAAFAWTRHKHPRPDELLLQTQSWADYIKRPPEGGDKLERYAYAWIAHQKHWDSATSASTPPSSESPMDWNGLLNFEESSQEKDMWLTRTLPLLARPELGFPSKIQKRLLSKLPADEALKQNLLRERRMLVTDAIVAARMQRGEVVSALPKDQDIEDVITRIDNEYAEGHNDENFWRSEIERTKRPNRPKRPRSSNRVK